MASLRSALNEENAFRIGSNVIQHDGLPIRRRLPPTRRRSLAVCHAAAQTE